MPEVHSLAFPAQACGLTRPPPWHTIEMLDFRLRLWEDRDYIHIQVQVSPALLQVTKDLIQNLLPRCECQNVNVSVHVSVSVSHFGLPFRNLR